MYRLGKRSVTSIKTCHIDLQTLAYAVIREAHMLGIDFGIHVGHRSVEDQWKAYKEGNSTKTGKPGDMSKHNYTPSLAYDFHIFVPGKPNETWNSNKMMAIGLLHCYVADKLFKQGKMKHRIRWGADWDGDAIIGRDQNLWDPGHIELLV